ncbi:MAG: hypothetical protein JOZ43_01985 [Acidobacteriales bacterium]|nr:hypothetical protein [Terriglobales bacterium]
MFVVLIHYTKPLAEVDLHKPAHSAYLDQFYANKTMIVSGRRVDGRGGVLIANIASRAELDKLIASDPYKLNGVAEYEVIDFHPGKYAQEFGAFIHATPVINELRPDTPIPGGDVGTTSR